VYVWSSVLAAGIGRGAVRGIKTLAPAANAQTNLLCLSVVMMGEHHQAGLYNILYFLLVLAFVPQRLSGPLINVFWDCFVRLIRYSFGLGRSA
jgi:hypothetical protein